MAVGTMNITRRYTLDLTQAELDYLHIRMANFERTENSDQIEPALHQKLRKSLFDVSDPNIYTESGG